MQYKLLDSFLKSYRDFGLKEAFSRVLIWIFNRAKELIGLSDQIEKRREKLSARLNATFNATVHYGIFKGMKLSSEIWWGKTDRASMLLGIYEKEVLDKLKKHSDKHLSFVELGAADGYYGVGVLVSKLFKRSYCFEISPYGRQAILKNALLNNVGEDIRIFGEADLSLVQKLSSDVVGNCVLLSDIEGGEFKFFNKDMLLSLSKSTIIIETHSHFFADGQEKLDRLLNDAKLYFNVEEFTTSQRDLSKFNELKTYSDNDRWLICSEGRRALPKWLILTPIGDK